MTASSIADILRWLYPAGLCLLEAAAERACGDDAIQVLGFEVNPDDGMLTLLHRGPTPAGWSADSDGRSAAAAADVLLERAPTSGGLVVAGVTGAGTLLIVDLIRAGSLSVAATHTAVEVLRSWVSQLYAAGTPLAVSSGDLYGLRGIKVDGSSAPAGGVLVTDAAVSGQAGAGVVHTFRHSLDADVVSVSPAGTLVSLADRDYRIPHAMTVGSRQWDALVDRFGRAERAIEVVAAPAPISVVEPDPAPSLAPAPEPQPAPAVTHIPAPAPTRAPVHAHVHASAPEHAPGSPSQPEPAPAPAVQPEQPHEPAPVAGNSTELEPHIWVRVFGNIRINAPGSEKTLTALNGHGTVERYSELITRIVLSPEGLSVDDIDATVWPDGTASADASAQRKARNNFITRARGALRTSIEPDRDPLPQGTDGRWRAHSDVVSDWSRFCQLVPAIPSRARTEDLLKAVVLLTGPPFADAPKGSYGWTAHLRDRMLDRPADAALELARRMLATGNTQVAFAAAGHGLNVNPDRQDLWEILLDTSSPDEQPRIVEAIARHIPLREQGPNLKAALRKVMSPR